jgi:hypothetical protein
LHRTRNGGWRHRDPDRRGANRTLGTRLGRRAVWREQLESRTLDLAWVLPHLRPAAPRESILERRVALQDLLRAGYLAETIAPSDDSP